MPRFHCQNGRCPRFRRVVFVRPDGRPVECEECGLALVAVLDEPDQTPAEDPTAGHFYALLTADPEAALREVTARRELHWARFHPRSHPDQDSIACQVCLVLDGQRRRARQAAGDQPR